MQKPCFHCGGNLRPTPKTSIESNGFTNIHIQIYNCVDCGRDTKIPVRPTFETQPSELTEPHLIDEIHDDPLA